MESSQPEPGQTARLPETGHTPLVDHGPPPATGYAPTPPETPPETGHAPPPETGHAPPPETGHALLPETGRVPPPADSGERLPLLPGFREMAMRRMSEERRRLIAELVEQRQSARLSQTQVAARMGTSQSAVARLEGGLGDVRASTLERYAAAVGCQITWRLRD